MTRYLIFSILLLSGSCKFFRKKGPDEKPVARVFDSYLYPEDLKGLTMSGMSPKDSAAVVQAFINNWVKQQVVLNKAETNLSDEQKDKERQIADYRNTLIIYEYEQELVRQRLDTSVSFGEIKKYYEENLDDFELRENIVKLHYIKFPPGAPGLDKAWLSFKSGSDDEFKKTLSYTNKYAINAFFDDQAWLSFDDIIKEIPIKTYDQEHFLNKNNLIKLEDSDFVFFIKIKDFRIKNSTSPLEFEVDKIRNIILNKRKLKLISEMENSVLKNAQQKKEVEIY